MSAPARAAMLPILKAEQAEASTPDRHVWLSASAGTGKTQVLAARVYRLLLRGVDPGAILALTFTKAGAAEMAARINGRLAAWVRMPDEALRKDLFALGEVHDDARVERARTLFARVLDAPGGGVRIQTIHGFCQGLLAAFPLEAELTPGFRPLEAREEAQLQREALSELLVAAERDGRDEPVEAMGALSLRLGEGGAEAFLRECARKPDALAALPVDVQAHLRRAMDLPEGDIATALEAGCCDEAFDLDALRRIARANRAWGVAKGHKHADIADRWLLAPPAERAAMLEELISVVFTAKGEPQKHSAKLIGHESDYAELALALGECCAEMLSLATRAAYADLLARALAVGRNYAAAYTRAKRRTGAVDFDDLIRATVNLLGQPGMGDWVRYKLDQGTEHILIDEAQDTNAQQWAIVRALAGEFFAGEGAHGREVRTLFTVGDYKQAIFGFQGTDPAFFSAAERMFQTLAEAGFGPDAGEGAPWARLSLTHSFRSTKPVLEFVDAALAAVPDPGLGTDLETHLSEVPGGGRVELWPPVVAGGSEDDEEGWIDDATREVAARIAREVKAWLAPGSGVEVKGRKLEPQDVMVLVKRRGDLASLLVARLHAEGVPVAGVDRLRLNAPLAVQDLLAAVRFALQPEDNLALASLLVSPLLGWTQEDLLDAAVPRPDGLWPHLVATQPEARIEPLRRILARVDIATPYQFLEELLSGKLDGRRKLLRRLGAEARDPIEELLNAALAFETQTAPSLQLFLDWFDRGEVEIVRDASQPQAAVRVMTAHGAKGLQAPVVILADACIDPASNRRDILAWSPDGVEPAFPIFRPRKEERAGALDAVVTTAERREMEEHWRLFYVAATRAEERLVIAGALGSKAKGVPPPSSWYATAARALTALGVEEGTGARVFTGVAPTTKRAKDRDAKPTAPVVALPDWATRPAPVEARPTRPLAPSALGDDEVADPPPGPAMRVAAERGRLIHQLLERLPAVVPDARPSAAARWLAAAGVEDGREIAASVLDVIARFDGLFGPDSLAEAPIAAVLSTGQVVSGTVDRLLVEEARVRVVDFKTGRLAPATLEEVPGYHLRQMAAYADALRVIFPGRAVEVALVYTAGPVQFDLPADLLARHKPGYAATEQS